jgi:hypothetical protein
LELEEHEVTVRFLRQILARLSEIDISEFWSPMALDPHGIYPILRARSREIERASRDLGGEKQEGRVMPDGRDVEDGWSARQHAAKAELRFRAPLEVMASSRQHRFVGVDVVSRGSANRRGQNRRQVDVT